VATFFSRNFRKGRPSFLITLARPDNERCLFSFLPSYLFPRRSPPPLSEREHSQLVRTTFGSGMSSFFNSLPTPSTSSRPSSPFPFLQQANRPTNCTGPCFHFHSFGSQLFLISAPPFPTPLCIHGYRRRKSPRDSSLGTLFFLLTLPVLPPSFALSGFPLTAQTSGPSGELSLPFPVEHPALLPAVLIRETPPPRTFAAIPPLPFSFTHTARSRPGYGRRRVFFFSILSLWLPSDNSVDFELFFQTFPFHQSSDGGVFHHLQEYSLFPMTVKISCLGILRTFLFPRSPASFLLLLQQSPVPPSYTAQTESETSEQAG